jgi:hypothetical protein
MENELLERFITDPVSFFIDIFGFSGGAGGVFEELGIGEYLTFLRWTFILLDAALLLLIGYAFIKALGRRPRLHPEYLRRGARMSRFAPQELSGVWETIVARTGSGTGDAFKLAIIEADKLMDEVLRGMGLQGEHTIDRIRVWKEKGGSHADSLLRAHRLRNDIVHNANFSLGEANAKRTLGDYEAFLRSVDVI